MTPLSAPPTASLAVVACGDGGERRAGCPLRGGGLGGRGSVPFVRRNTFIFDGGLEECRDGGAVLSADVLSIFG